MIKNSTPLSQLIVDMRAKAFDLRERLSAKDSVILSIVDESGSSVGSFLRGLAENFRVSLIKSVNEASLAGSIGSPFHADAGNDGITLRFSEGAALDDGDGSTKSEDVVDPPVDTEIITL